MKCRATRTQIGIILNPFEATQVIDALAVHLQLSEEELGLRERDALEEVLRDLQSLVDESRRLTRKHRQQERAALAGG